MGKKLVKCGVCKGKGEIKDKAKSSPFHTEYKTCHACNGSGEVAQTE